MTATVVEMPPSPQMLEEKALSIPDQARALTVRDQESVNRAGAMLTDVIKPLRREAAEVFDPIIASAHKAHKDALAGKARVEAPLIEAEGVLKRSVGEYLAEQERLRQVEETRLRAEQEAREREEAARLEAERIEHQRILNEQLEREHAEEIERKLEALPADAPAELVADLCNTPAPEPIRIAPEMPVFTPVATVAPKVAAPAGVSLTQRWKAEVTSLRTLCRAIADGTVPAHYVTPDMSVLNGLARANRQSLNIPGVRAVAESTVSARGR